MQYEIQVKCLLAHSIESANHIGYTSFCRHHHDRHIMELTINCRIFNHSRVIQIKELNWDVYCEITVSNPIIIFVIVLLLIM